MGGQAGARGYLLQTLICVLDSLNDSNNWHYLEIEPCIESEKVDIQWDYGNRFKVVQVKSSQNQIDLPSAKKWATELEASITANEYELRLLGPCSKSVTTVGKIGSVAIPSPETLDIQTLTEQAAHKLDRYVINRQLGTQLSPLVREILVGNLSHRFSMFSTAGESISRADFDAMLSSWIKEIQPPITPIRGKHTASENIRQINAPPREFFGRIEELEKLQNSIKSGSRLIGIRGMPGVGKSAFTAKLLTTISDSFSDWQIQIDLRGHTSRPVTIAEAMRSVIEVISSNTAIPNVPSALEGLYRSTIHNSNAILLLENAPNAEIIEALDPNSNVLVVFTSRNRFSSPSQISLDILPLDCNSANKLLLSISPRLGDKAPVVASLCGSLPLALRLTACSFADRPDIEIDDFIFLLTQKRTILEFVEASFQLSFELLDDHLKSKFCLLSLFPFDFDTESAAAVWQDDTLHVSSDLGALLKQSLIEWDNNSKRYWMHDLIHEFANVRCEDSLLEKAKWHFCEYFHNVCFDIEYIYKQGHENVIDSLFLFDTERSNLEIALKWLAFKAEENSKAAQMCVDFVSSTVFPRDLRQHPFERILWLSMGYEAAQQIPDGISALTFHGNTGRAWADLGHFDKALKIHQEVLEASRKFNRKQIECGAHLQIGNMLSALGKYREAISSFEASRKIAVKESFKSFEAHALSNLGNALTQLCEFELAFDYLSQGSSIFAELGDQLNFAKSIGQTSRLSLTLGDYNLAIEMGESSLGIVTDLKDPLSIIQIGRTLGEALTAAGKYERAIAVLEDNVELAKQLGLSRFVFAGLRKLAIAYEHSKLPEMADASLNEHQQAAQVVEDQHIIRAGKLTLADILEARGKYSETIHIYENELVKTKEEKDLYSEMKILSHLSKLYEQIGNKEQSSSALQRVCEIASTIGHPLTQQFQQKLNEQ